MKTNEQLALETTIMACREVIMAYFKGTTVDSVVKTYTNVSRSMISEPSSYNYQRRQQQQINKQALLIGGTPILYLLKHPREIHFKIGVLNRSKEFQEIHRELEKFLKRYLRAVTIKEVDKRRVANKDDSDKILVNLPADFLIPGPSRLLIWVDVNTF